MKNAAQKTLQALVDLRIEFAISRLKEKPKYMELNEAQKATEAKLEKMLRDSYHKEQIPIDLYFENQSIKEGFEFDEIYYQGLKDCFYLMKLLGVIQEEGL
ncbi:hypothetical protein QA584_06925 [Anaerocolumna sp. AGMB13025]|uniref:hypothetical protein n=1 Tax=Anaerocolumna sp. AGMB13025 TaxID=3039116 RepID=UPI00241C2E41|nr:hypothetical protein [Anaerocolumna sp. AGMB13025]WFR58806.1 hypothetical protein QA584_06925 [Anaerocolumna sp. AGMB13025]